MDSSCFPFYTLICFFSNQFSPVYQWLHISPHIYSMCRWRQGCVGHTTPRITKPCSGCMERWRRGLELSVCGYHGGGWLMNTRLEMGLGGLHIHCCHRLTTIGISGGVGGGSSTWAVKLHGTQQLAKSEGLMVGGRG